MSACWHVVVCKPRQEVVAEENLRRQGFESYLPRLRVRRRRLANWQDRVEALFPRYLFLRVDADLQNVAPIRSTRGAMGLLRFGLTLAVVPAPVLEALKHAECAAGGAFIDPERIFAAGQQVEFVSGPLAGLGGVVTCPDGEARSRVLIELLGKQHRISIAHDCLHRAA